MSETLAASAQTILQDWIQSESLRKHCYAVADSIKHFAQLRGENADLWEAVGLLHVKVASGIGGKSSRTNRYVILAGGIVGKRILTDRGVVNTPAGAVDIVQRINAQCCVPKCP